MSTSARRDPVRDGLFLLGLVGRTGSGKSTVARVFEEAGAVVLDADRLGHEVTDGDPEVRAALEAEYGAGAYLPGGKLDRARVAARVFAEPEARRRLDQLVHPRILRRIASRLDQLRGSGHRGAVVVDAALLLDWGLERGCDAVVAVVAPEAVQLERLASSRGWTPEHARRRLAVQRTAEEFRAAADVTIDNRGTRDELEAGARETLARLLAHHEARLAALGKEPC